MLNSPSEAIVRAAAAELAYQATMLDALGTNASSKMVVHIGGLYGGREAVAMDR